MTRQAAYRLQQLASGQCGRGCQRRRWGTRTLCRRCALDMREQQLERRLARYEQQRQQEAA